MKPIHVIMAVVGGAIAGATVGLLLAPKKGSETREDIAKCVRNKACCLKKKNKLEQLASDIEEEIDDKL